MNSVRPCTECSRRVAYRAYAARHLAVACRLEKPSPSLPPALSIHSPPLPSHSLLCSPSVSLTVSYSAWPSSRAAASLAPPLPRHHRASQHRLRVCFRRLDRLLNPGSAAVRRSPCHYRHNSRRCSMPPHTWPGGPRAAAGRAVGQARPRLCPAESSPPLPALSAEPGRPKP